MRRLRSLSAWVAVAGKLDPHLPQSQAPSEVVSPGTAIFKTDGKGAAPCGGGEHSGAELRRLHSHHPHSCPEPPPQAPRLRALPSRNLCTDWFCLLRTHSKSPGLEKPKVCLRLKEERNVYSGCSQDMLPQADHSILRTQNGLLGLCPCPVRSLQSQAPPHPMRGTLFSTHRTGTHRVTAQDPDPCRAPPPL